MSPRRSKDSAAGDAATHRRRAPGQRAGLSRAAVLAAALRIADHEGLEALSMRRLAAELGVAPNAIYTYIPDKGALLDALFDHLVGEIEAPDADTAVWQEPLAELMRRSRQLLLRHPPLVPLFFARPGGPNALRLGEAALRLLAQGGIEGERAVRALRSLLTFTFGFAAMELPRRPEPGGAGRLGRAAARIEALPAAEFAATRAVAAQLARHPDDDDFEAGLSWILRGIESG